MIKEVTIKGYKSIKEQTVALAPINVLIGANGIGKSNFISVFDLVRNIYNQNLQQFVIAKGGADRLLHFGKKTTQDIEVSLTFASSNEADPINTYGVSLHEAQDTLYVSQTDTAFYRNGVRYPQVQETNKKESSIKFKQTGQLYYVNSLLKDFDVYHFHDTGDLSPMKSKADLDNNHRLRNDGSNIAAFLYFLKKKHPEHYAHIEAMVASVTPFFKEFILQPDRLNEKVIQLEWREIGNHDYYLDAYQLSDGTLRFICLATLLLQPDPPKTIIIDEPELGLHPIAINKLAAMIRKISKEVQVIISTQSTPLVDNFNAEDIIVVDRQDRETVFKRLSPLDMERWLEEYSMGEIWEKNIIGGLPF